jgi:hypothetical protein
MEKTCTLTKGTEIPSGGGTGAIMIEHQAWTAVCLPPARPPASPCCVNRRSLLVVDPDITAPLTGSIATMATHAMLALLSNILCHLTSAG